MISATPVIPPAPVSPSTPAKTESPDKVRIKPADGPPGLSSGSSEGVFASGRDIFEDRADGVSYFPEHQHPGTFHSFPFPLQEISKPAVTGMPPHSWRLYGGGISLSYNNSWIINDETLAGLRPSSLTDTRFSHAPEIGISTVFASGKGQRIELEFFIISDQIQRFNQYINALYQARQLSLRYQKLHVSWLVPLKIIPVRAGIGGYYSILNRAEEMVSGKIRSVDDQYTWNDYGVTLQFAREYRLLSRLIVVPSLRIQYSLHNIFEGNDIIPGSYRNTHNASAGINLGLYYQF